MIKKKLAVLFLALVCSVTIVGCKKTNDKVASNNESPEISEEGTIEASKDDNTDKKDLKTLKSKEDVESFSRNILSKVQEILTNNGMESTLSSDGLKIYHDGHYEKLGKSYDVYFEGRFEPYSDTTDERKIMFSYRIPISQNADINNLNLPQINALIDIMLLSDEINSKFPTKEDLQKHLEERFNGTTNSDYEVFHFYTSNLKDEAECTILEGGFSLGAAIVEGNLLGQAAMYDFTSWNEYDSLPARANKEVFDVMQSLGIIESDAVYEVNEDDPIVEPLRCYINGTPLPDEEGYVVGMNKSTSDNFYIEYYLEGMAVPFDGTANKITNTKYIDAFIELLNNSDSFKNKFDKDELMAAIYDRAKISMDGSNTYLEVTIPGIESIEVDVNNEKTLLDFKIKFFSQATVEGQTSR